MNNKLNIMDKSYLGSVDQPKKAIKTIESIYS